MSGYAPMKAEIDAQNAKFMAAAQAGDAAALAALYTPDAWLLPPGAEMMQGRSKIEAFWANAFQQIASVKLKTIHLDTLGEDGAREIGSAQLTIKGQEQAALVKYVVVWRRIAGEWRLEADIWNAVA